MNAIIFDKNVDVHDLIIVYKTTQTLFMPILMNYIPLTGHKLLFSDTDISNEDNETILLAVKNTLLILRGLMKFWISLYLSHN